MTQEEPIRMHGGAAIGEDARSLREVLVAIIDDVRQLVRGELSLARSEAEDKVERVVIAMASIIGGALLGFAALNVLLAALVAALVNAGVPAWLAAVCVGVAVAIIGVILVWQGQKALSLKKLAPERTAANLKADARVVRNQLT